MDKLKFKPALLFLCSLFVTQIFATAPAKEYSKVIVKEYGIPADGNVILKNKHGKVTVDTWAKNSVKIKVDIIVDAKSQEKADEIFDRISILFDDQTNVVRCETEIESVSSGLWSWWWSGSNNAKFSINYEVFIPSTVELSLSNKYGDSFVNDLEGPSDYNIKYGNLTTVCHGGEVNLDLAYGKAKMEGLSDMTAEIKYSTLKCKQANEIILNSKYSDVFIIECDDLKCETKYDDYDLGKVRLFRNKGKYDDIVLDEVDRIQMETSYADLEIGRLNTLGEFNFKYGEAVIKDLRADFDHLKMEGNYADFIINLDGVRDCDVDVEGSYTDFNCDQDLEIITEVEKSNKLSIRGYLGTKGIGGDIMARLSYGSVKLR